MLKLIPFLVLLTACGGPAFEPEAAPLGTGGAPVLAETTSGVGGAMVSETGAGGAPSEPLPNTAGGSPATGGSAGAQALGTGGASLGAGGAAEAAGGAPAQGAGGTAAGGSGGDFRCDDSDAACVALHAGCVWHESILFECDGVLLDAGPPALYARSAYYCPVTAPIIPGCLPPVQTYHPELYEFCCDDSAAPVKP